MMFGWLVQIRAVKRIVDFRIFLDIVQLGISITSFVVEVVLLDVELILVVDIRLLVVHIYLSDPFVAGRSVSECHWFSLRHITLILILT